jgi:hypothetical protein
MVAGTAAIASCLRPSPVPLQLASLQVVPV